MTIQERQQSLINEFANLPDWESRYKRIIEVGKALPVFPEERRLDQFKVQGCQSQVWLAPEIRSGTIHFYADSDALITKGLIAILLKVYSGSTPQEIIQTAPDFIGELGLASKLSPNRANGLFAMVKQIKMYGAAVAMQMQAKRV